MAKEIERKFLVLNDRWREDVYRSVALRQGYLASHEDCSVRVRVSGAEAHLNIKSATLGVERVEFEYAIPVADGEHILATLCGARLVDKTRHYVRFGCHTWEIDVFAGANAGLVVAEIELGAVTEEFDRPPWVGREVSDVPRYYNVCLVSHPYALWTENERSGSSLAGAHPHDA